MTSKVTIWDTAKNDHKDGYGIKPDNIMAVIDSYDHVQDIVIDATKAIRLYSKLITATDKTFHVVVFSEPDGEAISVKHTFKIPAIVCVN